MADKPRIRRRQCERTELSDRRLKDAAIGLLIQRGVSGTTLAELGKRAGYSRGLATHRFGSKAGLFRYVLQSISQRWRGLLAQYTEGKSGVEALCGAVDAQLAFLHEAPNEVRAMYLLWFVSIDPGMEFRANVRHVNTIQRRDVAAWVESGQARGTIASDVEAARVAEQFCASMVGIIYQWLVGPAMPIEEIHRELKRGVRERYAIKVRIQRGAGHARRIHI